MGWKHSRCLFGLGLLTTGCSLYATAYHNITVQTQQTVDDCYEQKREDALAEVAWDHEAHAAPDQHFPAEYICGFKAGFADYLFGGGTGEPPMVPPTGYRTIQSETPDGIRADHDWFAGYRHGTRVARNSGYRGLIVIPLSGPLTAPNYRPGEQRGLEGPTAATGPAEAVLPMPRPIEPAGPPVPAPPADVR